MLKGIVKLIGLVGLVAGLFTVIQFVANYDVHKNPKEFFSSPFEYIKKVEKQKEDEFIGRLKKELKPEETLPKDTKMSNRLRLPIYISLIILALAVVLLVFYRLFLDKPRKSTNMEDLYNDDLWDDDRHPYS